MLLTDIKEAQKLARVRVQPNLCFVPYSVVEMLAEIRATQFSDLSHQVGIHFVSLGPLACVFADKSEPVIYLHQVLNHPETPFEVISHVCKHELLHLRIPSVEKNGKWQQHSPAFWEAERALSPERKKAWAWVWTNLGGCLKRRPRLERIDVRRCWKDIWSLPKINIDACVGAWKRRQTSRPGSRGWLVIALANGRNARGFGRNSSVSQAEK